MIFEFWLKNEKEQIDLLLPVTPSTYEITDSNSIEVVEATSIGDININGNRRAINVMLEGFFSVKNESYVNMQTYPVNNCIDYVELIKKWKNDKSIIRLIIADEEVTKINSLFYIESITYSENHESNGDINYRISLKEYRELTAPVETTIINDLPRANKQTPNAKTYTVESGDNLHKIARKMYGDSKKWTNIYETNKNIIGNNPNLIYVGQKFIIP